MKKILLFFLFLCAINVNAQTTLTQIIFTDADCSTTATLSFKDVNKKLGDNFFVSIPDGEPSNSRTENISESFEVIIAGDITNVGEDAFAYCRSLVNVSIQNGVEALENKAFYNCTALETFAIFSSTPLTLGSDVFTGVPIDCELRIPNLVMKAYTDNSDWSSQWVSDRQIIAFVYNQITFTEADCITQGRESGILTWEDVNTKLNYEFGTSISDYSSTDRNVIKDPFEVIITGSITNIGEYAFANCGSLGTVNMLAVTNIGEYAFTSCGSLVSVNMLAVTNIGSLAFRSCGSLVSVNMLAVTNIGSLAFTSCGSLVSVNMPAVTNIGEYAFRSCGSLVSVNMPAVTNIGIQAFRSCGSLVSVNMPAVTNIGIQAFAYCSSLGTVNMPAVTNIRSSAFESCSSLESITILNLTPPTLSGLGVFSGVPTDCKLYVPSCAVEEYRNHSGWNNQWGTRQIIGIGSINGIGVSETSFVDGLALDKNNKMINDNIGISFNCYPDSDKDKEYTITYEILNSKNQTLYQKDTTVSKADLESSNYVLLLLYSFQAGGDGDGKRILTIMNANTGNNIFTLPIYRIVKTFTITGVHPNIVPIRKINY